MTQQPYLLVGEDGSPLGMVDIDKITDEGHRLAFALAIASNDIEAMNRIQAETLSRVGTDSFGYVCANALRVMAEYILAPSLDIAAALGHDLRGGIQAIAEGRDPAGGGIANERAGGAS